MHLNKVIFIGRISNDLKMAYQSNGHPRTAFTLIIDQPAKDGIVYKLYVPIEAWGKVAELVAGDGDAGQEVYIEGKLVYKKAEKGFVVMASHITLETSRLAQKEG